jgi:homoserine O-acetyltransferase
MSETQLKYLDISTAKAPFKFADGGSIHPMVVAYETYGTLNSRKDNAILVFHALSGSAHASGTNKAGSKNVYWTDECHAGWWGDFIGPGMGIDTTKYFVICANYIGGCYGSTGPASINPKTGKPYGSAFPFPTITDIVESQVRILDHLGIKKLLAVVGASLGGFCVMDFAVRYPQRVKCVIPVASGVRATVLSKAMNFEQIFAIQEDANFRGGDYYDGQPPTSGLTLARMISHKTFVSLTLLESRAKKAIVQPDDVLSGYKLQHQVESYLLHQGKKFVKRFDANTYIRIASAWQSFDLPRQQGKALDRILSKCRDQEWLIFSISTDVCFYPNEQAEIATALKANNIDFQHITVHSEKGHDSFLLEPDLYAPYISYKLGHVFRQMTEENGEKHFTI